MLKSYESRIFSSTFVDLIQMWGYTSLFLLVQLWFQQASLELRCSFYIYHLEVGYSLDQRGKCYGILGKFLSQSFCSLQYFISSRTRRLEKKRPIAEHTHIQRENIIVEKKRVIMRKKKHVCELELKYRYFKTYTKKQLTESYSRKTLHTNYEIDILKLKEKQ